MMIAENQLSVLSLFFAGEEPPLANQQLFGIVLGVTSPQTLQKRARCVNVRSGIALHNCRRAIEGLLMLSRTH